MTEATYHAAGLRGSGAVPDPVRRAARSTRASGVVIADLLE
jgi:hypothetical protein